MVPIENGDERQPDDASIAAPPRPHASDWLWHPWYAKLWWSAVPVYWIGAAASVKIEALAGFYDTAFAGYCNVLFFPMTVLLVLGVGFARAWIEALPTDGAVPWSEQEIIWPRHELGKPDPSIDMFDPYSGTLYIGNALNPLNAVHDQHR